METVSSIHALRQQVSAWRRDRQTIALVPTMGNLHRGHLSLVDVAGARCDRVVCSIYVNPTQFGPDEDYDQYPRSLEADQQALGERDVALVFCPSNDTVYSYGEERSTWVEVPGLSDTLCGMARPGHFRGVTSVVCRLLNMVQPHYAVFGEKDYQQLVIIRRMVSDLSIPVEIVGGATQREEDGLAISSRNQYLSQEERSRAGLLYTQLCAVLDAISSGERDYSALEKRAFAELDDAGFRTDYVAVRATETLRTPGEDTDELVVLGAAWLGHARLIDNVRGTRMNTVP
jgi:pantoate--beta-alanine ligase